MTNTESDTMKTLTDEAVKNGAYLFDQKENLFIEKGRILFKDEAQLLATFNDWSAQQGWKLVPIRANSEMMNAGANYLRELQSPLARARSLQETSKMIYEEMLAFSPLKG